MARDNKVITRGNKIVLVRDNQPNHVLRIKKNKKRIISPLK